LFRDRFRRQSDRPSRLAVVSGIALPSGRHVVNDQRKNAGKILRSANGVDGL
jgi:hypothetical protein